MFGFVSLRGRARVALVAAGALSCFTVDAELLTGYSSGEGANTSLLIIDFGYLGGDAYQFEYSYDGDATGEDMLLALNEAGPLTVGYQVFDFGGRSIFVDGFNFSGNGAFPSFEGSEGENWSYWIADSVGDSYTSSGTGPSGRTLSDGSVDGWSLNVSAFNSQGFTPTSNPPAFVPEPTSLALLGMGGLLVIRRRR